MTRSPPQNLRSQCSCRCLCPPLVTIVPVVAEHKAAATKGSHRNDHRLTNPLRDWKSHIRTYGRTVHSAQRLVPSAPATTGRKDKT